MLDLSRRSGCALPKIFGKQAAGTSKEQSSTGFLSIPPRAVKMSPPIIRFASTGLTASDCRSPGEEEFHQTIALKNNRLLLLARHEGKIIAGVVIRFFPHGVMEYAANSSLQDALHLRPNDLLHWRAIEWGCREGMTHYSLGGAHLFLRKFGGEIVPTTRHRLDLSIFRRFAIGDWIADRAERARPLIPGSAGHRGALSKRLGRKAAQPARQDGRRPSHSTNRADTDRKIAVIVCEGTMAWCCASLAENGFC